jgi:serine/threonine-protein kinase
VNLLDRVKAVRRHALATVLAGALSVGAFVAGVAEVPPLMLAPIVPGLMVRTLRRRGRSLRESGLTLRQAILARSTGRALATPAAAPTPTARQLGKLASPDVLKMPHGAAIRRAAEDRAAILAIVAGLPKADRALLPDVGPAVNALVERVAHLAQALHRLDESVDPAQLAELSARIAAAEREGGSPDGERRLALFRRQRATLEEIAERRAALLHQLESAGLALGNLRLDLVKFRSAGGQAALTDVSTATQEARVLSREIADMLAAAAEVRSL